MFDASGLEAEINQLADNLALALQSRVEARINLMKSDDTAHYLIYRVLGVSIEEGNRRISV